MLTGEQLARAIAEAMRRKGVGPTEVARHFSVRAPSVHGWMKSGRIGKDKLPELFRYFSDVVGPEHWGLTRDAWPEAIHSESEIQEVMGQLHRQRYCGDELPEAILRAEAMAELQRRDAQRVRDQGGRYGQIPVIPWRSLENCGPAETSRPPSAAAEEWLPRFGLGHRAFALQVRGEAMAPSIPDGAVILIDPDMPPEHGSIVIVRGPGERLPRCMRLIYEGERPYIRPDNPAYAAQTEPLPADAVICGTVRRVIIDLD